MDKTPYNHLRHNPYTLSLIRENEIIPMQRSFVLFENSVNSEGTMKLYKKGLSNFSTIRQAVLFLHTISPIIFPSLSKINF